MAYVLMARRAFRAAAIAIFLIPALMACGDREADSAKRNVELNSLNAACVEAMLKSTCQVMSGPAATDSASVVFVAGIGSVDANAYRDLKASGEAMCAIVRYACRKEWQGPRCTTARALWPASSKPG